MRKYLLSFGAAALCLANSVFGYDFEKPIKGTIQNEYNIRASYNLSLNERNNKFQERLDSLRKKDLPKGDIESLRDSIDSKLNIEYKSEKNDLEKKTEDVKDTYKTVDNKKDAKSTAQTEISTEIYEEMFGPLPKPTDYVWDNKDIGTGITKTTTSTDDYTIISPIPKIADYVLDNKDMNKSQTKSTTTTNETKDITKTKITTEVYEEMFGPLPKPEDDISYPEMFISKDESQKTTVPDDDGFIEKTLKELTGKDDDDKDEENLYK